MSTSEQEPVHNLHYIEYESESGSGTCFVFIHGFASDATEWEQLCYAIAPRHTCYMLSLPGCGHSHFPEDFTPEADALAALLKEFLTQLPYQKKILCGYSMGARLALYTALYQNPGISGLVLESGTPGIHNPDEKIKRIEEDYAIADTIELLSGEDFEALWKSREIFSSQAALPPGTAERLKERRRRANPAVMAEYLRHFGTGVMPGMRNDLGRISVPVMIITGEKDEKFTRIGAEMCGLVPDGRHSIIPGAGHNTHLEKPADFVNLLFNFSENL